MVVVPAPTALTLKLTLVAPTAIGKEAGTVAAPRLLEFSAMVRLEAAAEESVNVMVPSAPVICRGEGVRVMIAPTVTCVTADVMPAADAVTVTDPAAVAFRFGWRAGAVWPPLKKMLVKVRFALAVSLLSKLTTTPF